MYSVRVYYPNGFLKFADILMNDYPQPGVEHFVDTVYALTWRGLEKKINKWMSRHQYDLKIQIYPKAQKSEAEK